MICFELAGSMLRAAVTNPLSKDRVCWLGTTVDLAQLASFAAARLCFGHEGGHYVGERRFVGVEILFQVLSLLFACFGLMKC